MLFPGRVVFLRVFKICGLLSSCKSSPWFSLILVCFSITLQEFCTSRLFMILGGVCTHGGSYGGPPANLAFSRLIFRALFTNFVHSLLSCCVVLFPRTLHGCTAKEAPGSCARFGSERLLQKNCTLFSGGPHAIFARLYTFVHTYPFA